MDYHSIVDPDSAPLADAIRPDQARSELSTLVEGKEALRFPGEDGGRSLTEMAQRDLEATLQLLVERAQYITGASGAAIALRQGEKMICRASAGPSAPEVGAQLQMNSGLSGESIQKRQILRCDDAETDPRVNRESCRALGIASVVVMPLVREEEVNGVFELLSGRAGAFEDRDLLALERLGEMIETAIGHAEAAKRAQKELTGEADDAAAPSGGNHLLESKTQNRVAAAEERSAKASSAGVGSADLAAPASAAAPESRSPRPGERGNIKKCEACGFPVSGGRTLCLDCEKAQLLDENSGVSAGSQPPVFLSQGIEEARPGWLRSHIYLIGAVLMMAITALVLLYRR